METAYVIYDENDNPVTGLRCIRCIAQDLQEDALKLSEYISRVEVDCRVMCEGCACELVNQEDL